MKNELIYELIRKLNSGAEVAVRMNPNCSDCRIVDITGVSVYVDCDGKQSMLIDIQNSNEVKYEYK